jgi:hypothetical protein
MATQEEVSRYFWSAPTNCPPVLHLKFQISTCERAYSLRVVWPAEEAGLYGHRQFARNQLALNSMQHSRIYMRHQGRILVEIVGEVEKNIGEVQRSSSRPPWKVRA